MRKRREKALENEETESETQEMDAEKTEEQGFEMVSHEDITENGDKVQNERMRRKIKIMKEMMKTSAKRKTVENLFVNVSLCAISYTEHVEVTLKVNHPNAGQIQWDLISPHGTKSTILPGRLLDSTRYMNLTVLTVQMWGENPNGYWRLEPEALFGSNLNGGTVEFISLKIHGFDCSLSDLRCLEPAVQDESFFTSPPPYEVTTDKTTDKPDRPSENTKSINHSVIIIVVVVAVIFIVAVILVVLKKKKKLCFKERLRSKNSEILENYPTEQHIPLKC
ncbi:Hypothetical predicted protein [Mytilus galloprovincialis]|uniref:P/Homo B domain-containing protein n=1 Tax=Mytilus galloprovincialis TaxID=29158 RepID=A0A8B6DN42_MYTGA|nr:Hypothetical predicted protein [Mytilus galloprovincialis]